MRNSQIENTLKATVISLFPEEINEPKPGLYPGYFVIPAAAPGDFSFLVVGDAVFYQETKNDQVLTIKTPFHVLAQSIVDDFMGSHLGRIHGVAEPGLFWVPGGFYDKSTIMHTFGQLIEEAEQKQLRWFEELVKIADDTYSRTRRHTSVSALQRHAVHRLGIQRPYVLRTGESANTCPFCKAETPYGAVKCPNCREILDPAAYRELVDSRKEEEAFKE